VSTGYDNSFVRLQNVLAALTFLAALLSITSSKRRCLEADHMLISRTFVAFQYDRYDYLHGADVHDGLQIVVCQSINQGPDKNQPAIRSRGI